MNKFRKTSFATAVAGLWLTPALVVIAQDEGTVADSDAAQLEEDAVPLEEIVVTSTRRSTTVQETPLNITAVGGSQIEELGFQDIDDVAKLVPGLTLVDQGPWGNNRIIVRGLNANNITGLGGGIDGGGTVATYLGETPLYVDFKLLDINRVESLLGPQGTLYGAGTLAGAVRYIPNRPNLVSASSDFHARVYSLEEGNGLGHSEDVMVNLPIIDGKLAVRGVFGFYDDPGFIDYVRVVRHPGISNPDPDLGDAGEVAANLVKKSDLNYEDTFSTRLSALYAPTDGMVALLTYAHQDTRTGGRQIQNVDAAGTGPYEAGYRYEEPSRRTADLGALELNFDFGFADLVSSSSYAEQRNRSQRDQTDLLLDLSYGGGYGYEQFPEFIAYTTGDTQKEQFTQELRLVSKDAGALNWIIGGFYNSDQTDSLGIEYTPGLGRFFGAPRVDEMEYYNKSENELEEKAVFGEIGYKITQAWQVTIGGRYFDYEVSQFNANDLPLLNSEPYELSPRYTDNSGGDDGTLFKFNTSYIFSDDLLVYATVSEGYRLGGINAVAPCPEPLEEGQQYVCALPNEVSYLPDSTTNYEIGLHSQWFDRRLTLNAALFYIDWTDVQIGTVTKNGAVGITGNGGGAESQGVELSFHAQLPFHLTLSGSYTYAKAELTEDVPYLLSDHFTGDIEACNRESGLDPRLCPGTAQSGDRLPGSPEHKGSLFLGYSVPLAGDYLFKANYGITAQSDVLTKPGARASGEALGGYAVSQLSFGIAKDNWEISLYGDNIFDKYATTAVSQDRSYVYDNDLGPQAFDVRRYGRYIIRPMSVGLDLRMHF